MCLNSRPIYELTEQHGPSCSIHRALCPDLLAHLTRKKTSLLFCCLPLVIILLLVLLLALNLPEPTYFQFLIWTSFLLVKTTPFPSLFKCLFLQEETYVFKKAPVNISLATNAHGLFVSLSHFDSFSKCSHCSVLPLFQVNNDRMGFSCPCMHMMVMSQWVLGTTALEDMVKCYRSFCGLRHKLLL